MMLRVTSTARWCELELAADGDSHGQYWSQDSPMILCDRPRADSLTA